MQPSRRHCLCASLALLAFLPLAPRTHAETLTITSSPPGATIEINGSVAGTTPYKTDFPGGYFHKTHTAFSSRLEHAMMARVSKDGYLAQQVTLTEGPFEWVAINGRQHGNYFLLKSSTSKSSCRSVGGTRNCRWMRRVKRGRCERRRANRRMVRRSKPRRGVGRLRSVPTSQARKSIWTGNLWGRRRRRCLWGRELITSR